MNATRRIPVTEESQVGEARRLVVQICQKQGNDETFIGRAAIVATEMARNLVLHGGGGEMLLRTIPMERVAGIELISIDRGPGMKHVQECLRDGYSTAGTAGAGLGSIQRLSSKFDLFAPEKQGTALMSLLLPENSSPPEKGYAVGAVSVADAREQVCGDGWDILQEGDLLRLIVADGLGHGPFAQEASREAIAIFRANPTEPPAKLLSRIDLALQKTRGAAATLVSITVGSGHANIAGVGNVAVRLTQGEKLKNVMADNGTLGTGVRRITENLLQLPPRALILLHSDGVSSGWDLNSYPGLTSRHPALIAAVIYRDHKRTRDDVTVVVARCGS